MRRSVKIGLIASVSLAVLACASFLALRFASARSEYTDAGQIRVDAAAAPIRRILWQPAAPVSTARAQGDEYEPRISSDGTTMVFVRGRPGSNADLFASRWFPTGWSAPQPIESVNTPNDELGPELSRDGHSLYFYSDREGGLGGYDLWVSRLDGDAWGEPLNLGPAINSSANEYGPALTPDGTRLYFASNRLRPDEPQPTREAWSATVREARGRHDYDLYIATLSQRNSDPARPVAQLNTPADEGAPAVSPGGDFLYFASDRTGAGGFGGFDLYRTRLLSGSRSTIENLGAAINSAADDMDPALSSDGFRLFFSSNREAANTSDSTIAGANATTATDARALNTQPTHQHDTTDSTSSHASSNASSSASAHASDPPHPYTLWGSTSREVFLERDNAGSRIALLELWSTLWPWLLLLLFTALLAWALTKLLRNAKWRKRFARLSLLAQCLLISIALHILIGGLLAIWQVGNKIGEYIGHAGGNRVVLASSGTAGDISGQIRSSITSLPTPLAKLGNTRAAIMVAQQTMRPLETGLAEHSPVIDLPSSVQLPAEPSLASVQSMPNLSMIRMASASSIKPTIPAQAPADSPVADPVATAASPETRLQSLAQASLTSPTQSTITPADVRPITPTTTRESALEVSALTASPSTDAASTATPSSLPRLNPPALSTAPSITPASAALPRAVAADADRSSEASLDVRNTSIAETRPGARAPLNALAGDRSSVTHVAPADVRPTMPTTARESALDASSLTAAPQADAAGAATPSSLPRLNPSAPGIAPSIAPAPAAVPRAVAADSERSSEAVLETSAKAISQAQPDSRAPLNTPAGDRPSATHLDPAASSQSASPATPSSSMRDSPGISDTFTDSRPAGSASQPSSNLPNARLLPRADEQPITARLPGASHPENDAGAPSGSQEPQLSTASVTALPRDRADVSSSLPATGTPATLKHVDAAGLPSSTPSRDNEQAGPAINVGVLAPHETANDAANAASSNAATAPLSAHANTLALPTAPSVAVGLPAEEAPPEPKETFDQRAPEVRADVLGKMGGSVETERAVGLALDWFVRHQEPDGRWTGRAFDDHCGKCGGAGEFDSDAAMTGITLLCFLGAGHTHIADGPYKEHVAKAIAWLLARQAESGDVRQGETMYSQTVATVALCEALAMTRDPKLTGPTRRAVAYLDENSLKRTPRGRDAKAVSDNTSVLGWQVMAIKSARRAGIDVSNVTFDAAKNWLEYVRDQAKPGHYSYRKGEAPTPAMTAEAMFVQQLLGHSRDETSMKQSAQFVLTAIPKWSPAGVSPAGTDTKDSAAVPSTYYWYYATLALFQHQGEAWKTWNEALVPALLNNQHTTGPAAGSWDPQDQWSRMGGRVYQTAICTLSLEVYYRYKPEGVDVAPSQKDAAP